LKIKANLDPKLKIPDELSAKIDKAVLDLNVIVNSVEYNTWCLSFHRQVSVVTRRFLGVPTKTELRWYKGFSSTKLTNSQVLDRILSGSETLTPIKDEEADINLSIDWDGSKRVVGYTYPNSVWQWINGWFIKSGSVADIRGNIWHEYMHKLGFTHPRKYSVTRQNSVPYQHGYYVRDFNL
jgi:hypothetical protein